MPEQMKQDTKEHQTACKYCGVIIDIVAFDDRSQYSCPRCHNTFYRAGESFGLVASMALAALMFFIPTLFIPVLRIEIMGINQSATLIEAVWHFADDGYLIIAMIALASGVIFPIMMLLLMFVMISATYNRHLKHWIPLSFRMYEAMKEWAMAEVYLIGIVVAIVKLSGMAQLHVDYGLILFALFLLTFYIALIWFNPEDIWRMYAVEE
jgi:paraquat-inducible protein A